MKKGINVASIHGDRDQNERTKTLNDFKNGKVPIIVATDVLARGIDIANVSLIINYDVPHAVEDYIHRIGRTGRYDKTGIAVTLVAKKDARLFKPIREKVGNDIEIINGDAILESSFEIKPKSGDKITAKRKQEPKKNSDQTNKGVKPDKKPDFSSVKNIEVTTNEDGKFIIELLNKSSVEKEAVKDKKTERKITVIPKRNDKFPNRQAPKKDARTSNNHKKTVTNRNKKQQDLKRPPIEIKKIDKAIQRNQKSRKPGKGIWGLIKSMLPKF